MLRLMRDMLKLIWWVVIGLFRSRASLEVEIVALRHQLNVLRRKSTKRLAFSNFDRLIFAGFYRIAPNVLNALVIVKPETVIGWHRAGFRLFWKWKSRSRSGRPKVPLEIRQLIRDVSLANPLWGAPRIHGEFLKLGIEIGQTSVAKYMARHRKPPSQGWKTFLHNHADGFASIDLFVVPTLSFRLLFGLLIMLHGRRIHGELLKLGIEIGPNLDRQVYGKHRRPPLQGWRTFPATTRGAPTADWPGSCRESEGEFRAAPLVCIIAIGPQTPRSPNA